MPLKISIPQLQLEAKKEVHDARRNGTFSTLTPRMVRRALETKLDLQEGALDDEDFRAPLKSAIKEAATEDIPSTADVSVPKTKKRKSEEMLEPKPNKKQNAQPPKAKKSSKQFKSSETVPTSDIEEDMEVNGPGDTSAELEKPPAAQSGESVKENKVMSAKPPKKSNPPKASGSRTKPSPRPSTASTPEAPVDSDSELSVLDDEPPKKKKLKTTKPKDKGDGKSKSSKGKATVSLSKDEETIKRLKSLVLACGIRKQWAKVFKDVDSPSQQIRILKQTLTDLGMSGRMSLEQAKAIKEKRELAQELEDVQAFAAATTKSKAKASEAPEEDEEGSEEELPAKRKTNARKSIMAFLGDQSDDE
ncbi:hypothetical protein B0H14DRAFT_726856 [Mycena olivaceomarginata]|nr:hypothetical protein B0H14DRAFT_726856 [Mycena olivaceomarginata]